MIEAIGQILLGILDILTAISKNKVVNAIIFFILFVFLIVPICGFMLFACSLLL